ncbi:MAG: Aspartyl/glutamyl-tRNA(Asn/Gln) amidotransferase subunit B [Clostridiales bacterium 38_11]|nr:MAG: Aspartyl/glutamyl-tRNA(Asn/Gln) amidotransferase subunit B [Clostridiales bacterium 38_11]HBH11870.1 Asp-tRNA(Asn)/Glu-tRNA(Gln) amidotransferase GatCAB subunit B [Clostridiales bacterium]
MSAYETVIGLEIHVELATESKIFCSCPTTFGAEPNKNTCPVCIGLPGVMPVLNEEVVDLAVKAGVALNCDINLINKMDRKNYFYPDLPKAYQISQFDLPICVGGHVDVEVDGKKTRIRLTRIHIEEDAGKLIHLEEEENTLIDYNRGGVPLVEIVTDPDIRSAEEAVEFLKTLRAILVYSGISDCRMEQGSMRCDVNISVREFGSEILNTKVEIKNMNSMKEVHKAIKKEEARQIQLYSYGEGHKVIQETRRWDAAKGRTITMRTKENAQDYRYFPEPDLPPVIIPKGKVTDIRKSLPELPTAKKERMMENYGLSLNEIRILIEEKSVADFYEAVVHLSGEPKEAANWIITELLRVLKTEAEIPVTAQQLSELILEVKKGTISRTSAKDVFEGLVVSDKSVAQIIQEKGLMQISSSDELEAIVHSVLRDNPQAVEDYKSGKGQSFGFLMGQCMKASKGKGNPGVVKSLLEKALGQ